MTTENYVVATQIVPGMKVQGDDGSWQTVTSAGRGFVTFERADGREEGSILLGLSGGQFSHVRRSSKLRAE